MARFLGLDGPGVGGLARKTPLILSLTPSNRRSRLEHNLVIYLNLGRRRYGT
ncbi:MAG: hypothetical protein ACRC8Y_15820 [Chroococcales cyanobacterium]